MWECPREQSHRRAKTYSSAPSQPPRTADAEEKAITAQGECSKTPDTGTCRTRNINALHGSSQTDANRRWQGKGESVSTGNDELRATVLEGSDSPLFQSLKIYGIAQ